MTNVEAIVVKFREFLTHGIRILPLILGFTSLVFGLGVGNIAFAFIAIGILLLVPLVSLLGDALVSWLLGLMPFIPRSLYTYRSSPDSGILSNPAPGNEVVSTMSYWTTSLAFFFSYFFLNAVALFERPAVKNASYEKVQARKVQSAMAIVVAAIVFLLLIIYRMRIHSESPLGLFFGIAAGAGLGYGWFEWLKACSGDRLVDLFGIANRIMSADRSSAPQVCVPVP
jgi:magnesium-transporting ATPase (P-type)